MLKYRKTYRDPEDLKLGAHFDHVDYDWRPYEKRSEAARADYDRLEKSLRASGYMENSLIVADGCVLIGMRRLEIARKLGWAAVPCWEITDDISQDAQPDRVLELRDKGYGEVQY